MVILESQSVNKSGRYKRKDFFVFFNFYLIYKNNICNQYL